LEANPNGYYVEDESTSYHEQAITMKREQVEERKEEKIEVLQDLEEVSIKDSSKSTNIPELPRDEQKETIEVEKPLEYSSHVILVHDSFLDEKLFENTQSDLPNQETSGINL
jgi:hypothetical protein